MPSKFIEKTKLLSKNQLAADIYLLKFKSPEISKAASAGQFINLSFSSETSSHLINRPFSIHNIEGPFLELLIKVVGPMTSVVANMHIQDNVKIIGPLGNAFSIPEYKTILLLGGGIGIAPLYFLEKSCLKKNNIVHALYCAPNHKDLAGLAFSNLICHIDSEKNCFATDYLHELISDLNIQEIKACGPEIFLEKTTEIAREINIPIEVSLETVMACGFGACLGCAIETSGGIKKVCTDGPIFKGDEIW